MNISLCTEFLGYFFFCISILHSSKLKNRRKIKIEGIKLKKTPEILNIIETQLKKKSDSNPSILYAERVFLERLARKEKTKHHNY